MEALSLRQAQCKHPGQRSFKVFHHKMKEKKSGTADTSPFQKGRGVFFMSKPKLLITDNVDETGLDPLLKYFRIEKKVGLAIEELEKIIADYDCLVTRSTTALPAELVRKATKMKIIARAAIGVDNIDIFEATARKIAVINAPKGNAKVTAEHTIGLIFALLRHIPQAYADLKKGIWAKKKYVGFQISGKTLGIVGFGNVGKEVYRIAKGIGMKVLVCEPYTRIPKSVKKVTFEELLKESDIVTMHVPATYLTGKMINKSTLSLCKDGVYIINCSRGAVVDEKAIKEALKSGKVAGFAVDVFTKEPEVDPELLSFPNVIATPHIAGSTYESQKQSIHEVAGGILEYIKGNPPSNLLNPQVFQKREGYKVSLDFDAVIFDCDSTLSAIEGIDELAVMTGNKDGVAKLTQAAMEGRAPYDEVFERRLEIIKPKKKDLEAIGRLYINNLVEDAGKVIEALLFLGKEVYIISGGYTAALVKLGEKLGIPPKNIFGNDLLFDKKGNYKTFIEGPLRRNHGKLQIIRQIPGKKIMIGDSITDLEVKECVDLFVGYGAVARRERVEKESEIYLYTQSLAPVLAISAGVEGCIKLLDSKYKRYVGKGLDLLFHRKHVKAEKELAKKLNQFKKLAYY